MVLDSDAARAHLVDFLKGGFAPVVKLLREFHYDKAAVKLNGLPFSAWSLLQHMHRRQKILLHFMKFPEENIDLWPEAYWPENHDPQSEEAWKEALDRFEKDLTAMIAIVEESGPQLFQLQKNGKTFFWAAVATLQHNAYHIGQIKAIGRQLDIW